MSISNNNDDKYNQILSLEEKLKEKYKRFERLNKAQNAAEYQFMIVSHNVGPHRDDEDGVTVVSLAEGINARECLDAMKNFQGGAKIEAMLRKINSRTEPVRLTHCLDHTVLCDGRVAGAWAYISVGDKDFRLKDWFNKGRDYGAMEQTKWAEWPKTKLEEQYYMDNAVYDDTFIIDGWINVVPPNFIDTDSI